MPVESHICTACGYEGKPIRPPSDHVGEDEPFAIGILNRLFFVLTFIPLKFGWMVRLAKRGKVKHCPNCGLPLMVKLSSDAGWLAKRKNDIKAGLYVPGQKEKATAFGREVTLPGDDKNDTPAPAPIPEKLPAIDALLAEVEKDGEIMPDTLDTKLQPKVKKPLNPDEW